MLHLKVEIVSNTHTHAKDSPGAPDGLSDCPNGSSMGHCQGRFIKHLDTVLEQSPVHSYESCSEVFEAKKA